MIKKPCFFGTAYNSTFANLEMTGKPLNYYKTYRDNIRAVTKAKVQEVAKAYIHPDRAIIMIVGDFEPCNKGGDKWPGPLDKPGTMRRLSLRDSTPAFLTTFPVLIMIDPDRG